MKQLFWFLLLFSLSVDAGNLLYPRAGHSAVVVKGKVLLIGGTTSPLDYGNTIPPHELLDPDTGTSSLIAPSQFSHAGGKGVFLLPNGKVLCLDANPEIYDPMSNHWTALSKLPAYGFDFNFAALVNGHVIALATVSNVYHLMRYDPVADRWTVGPVSPQFGGLISQLPSGRALLIGGVINTSTLPQPMTAATWIYDPVNNTLLPARSLPVPAQFSSAVLLGNGKVLVDGNQRNNSSLAPLVYSEASNTWTPSDTRFYTPLKAQNLSLIVLPGAKALEVNAFEIYDGATNRWAKATVNLAFRLGPTYTLLPSGKVLMSGGSLGGKNPPPLYLSTYDIYDPMAIPVAKAQK